MKIPLSRTYGENNYNRKSATVNKKRTKQSQGKKLTNINSKVNEELQETIVSAPNPVTKSLSEQKPITLQSILMTLFRLGICGVGLGTIFGTVLVNLDLTKPLFPDFRVPFANAILSPNSSNEEKEDASNFKEVTPPPSESTRNDRTLRFSQELSALRTKFKETANKYPALELSAFFVDLDNGAFVNYNGITPISAASTIKIPILVAFFQEVDAGKIHLDEKLTLTESNNVSGSGSMQYQGIGKQYSAIHTATQMIVTSDNAATEMIIERLGGAEALNQRFREWGMENTVIRNRLPDLEGTNTTTPRDLVMVLARVNQGDLVSQRSRDRIMDIMTRTETRTLLPAGIEPGAMIAHKTGDIGKVLGDAGIIDMPTGKRYIGAVMVKRPHNDIAGRLFIQDISRQAYQHFKWYLPRASSAQ